ncbi:hypothetical protein Patl1_12237 [Pistacia atlantica]|uniref:Uncharacterized protein n=1 Tax=Pistacia atlantica TaxID=434234 RepID=A0ACC1A7C6_9ROSI|nr:hypothetical protein Patl1_12237 [Pistacia atlantica]
MMLVVCYTIVSLMISSSLSLFRHTIHDLSFIIVFYTIALFSFIFSLYYCT